jgi:hypothetical protein
MNSLISVVALTLAAITPVLGTDIEPKAAVDFLLSTCLPAMDDLANLEKVGKKRLGFLFRFNRQTHSSQAKRIGWHQASA